MAFESWALALPLLALGIAVARWNIHVPLYAHPTAWRDELILSLGAGIYEELVFRLILMTVLVVFLPTFSSIANGVGKPANGMYLGCAVFFIPLLGFRALS